MSKTKVLAENRDKTKFIISINEERAISGETYFNGVIIGYMYRTSFDKSSGINGKKKGWFIINNSQNLYRKSDYTFYDKETFKKFNNLGELK